MFQHFTVWYGAEYMHSGFLPLTAGEMGNRGWDYVDVVLITGDAYVDHPSFGTAVIGRVLEKAGFRVAILSQPDWHSKRAFQTFGRPRLFFGISAGNMDSMVNRYTALKKVRNDDAYTEGAAAFKRPNRSVIVYAQRAREAFADAAIVIGGVEASLRRFAHYDYWQDRIRRSILLDSKADLLVYGMGEHQAVTIASRLARGEPIDRIRDIPGTLFALKENETPDMRSVIIPSFEELSKDHVCLAKATKLIYEHAHPHMGRTLVQYHGKRAVVQLPPPLPLSEKQMDAIYDLPFTRKPHPSYTRPIPAYEVIKNSITIIRGCFGGCSFCSIALHQGKFIQSRSIDSVLSEAKLLAEKDDFDGTITDLGGPTANMYQMQGRDGKRCERCSRHSCIHPGICNNLDTDHGALITLMRKVRDVRGVNHLFIASGIRMDLALIDHGYIAEIAKHHTSGYLKVAPEHVSQPVLRVMRKPSREIFEQFRSLFGAYSKEAGREQYLIPYLMVSHPGTTIDAALELALYLKEHGYRPRQIQDFLPSPMSLATAIYVTGRDPFTDENIPVPRGEGEKRLYRALTQYFKRENREYIRNSLLRLHRGRFVKKLLL
jgi:uncharacterized radical SAM protein YgiQ